MTMNNSLPIPSFERTYAKYVEESRHRTYVTWGPNKSHNLEFTTGPTRKTETDKTVSLTTRRHHYFVDIVTGVIEYAYSQSNSIREKKYLFIGGPLHKQKLIWSELLSLKEDENYHFYRGGYDDVDLPRHLYLWKDIAK